MRTIWNGSISFGLVNIPIGLALATQRNDVSFRTLHRECGTPIKQKRWCPFHEREVEADELVKGWEVAKGEFIFVEESDLEAVGKFVLWGKENLCLIRPQGETLALETLFFADDVRSKDEIEEAVQATEIKKAELDLAAQVIDSLVGDWNAADFENDYRRDLNAMLEAKLAGQEIKRPEPAPETPVVDLMEALRRSVEDVQGRRAKSSGGGARKAGGAKSKTAAARKSA